MDEAISKEALFARASENKRILKANGLVRLIRPTLSHFNTCRVFRVLYRFKSNFADEIADYRLEQEHEAGVNARRERIIQQAR